VWIWLLHLAWKAKNNTFTISNEQLRAFGVHRNTKYQALRELERAGLIQVVRNGKKASVVTLLYL
jgi:DNA-binding transcriptional regulator YhcF (GntR family)